MVDQPALSADISFQLTGQSAHSANICFQKPQTHIGGAPPGDALPQAWEGDQVDVGGADKKAGGLGEEAVQNAWEATGISKVTLKVSVLFQLVMDKCSGIGHFQSYYSAVDVCLTDFLQAFMGQRHTCGWCLYCLFVLKGGGGGVKTLLLQLLSLFIYERDENTDF